MSVNKVYHFCEHVQFQFHGVPYHVSYSVSAFFIKFFVHYNYPRVDAFNCLEEFDEIMLEFDLKSMGWSKFYVTQKVLETPIDGFTREWIFISFNSDLITEQQ